MIGTSIYSILSYIIVHLNHWNLNEYDINVPRLEIKHVQAMLLSPHFIIILFIHSNLNIIGRHEKLSHGKIRFYFLACVMRFRFYKQMAQNFIFDFWTGVDIRYELVYAEKYAHQNRRNNFMLEYFFFSY